MLVAIFALLLLAVTMFVMAFAKPKQQEDITQRVRRLQERVVTGALKAPAGKSQDKMAQAAAQSRHLLAPLVKKTLTPQVAEELQSLLLLAGRYDETPADLVSQQLLAALTFPIGFLIFNIGLFEWGPGGSLMGLLGTAYLGFKFPILKLRRLIKGRQRAIFRALPDSLDLLTICVEAGLGVNAALQAVVDRSRPSPLREELERTLREMQLGKPRVQAWRDLGARVGVRELTSFTIAMVQAEQMGTGLAKTLKVQSQILREARWRHAQELAQTAPIKMAIPLAVFIFPVIFIVIFGPIVIQFLIDR